MPGVVSRSTWASFAWIRNKDGVICPVTAGPLEVMALNEYDMVRLRRAIPEERLAQGAIGTIVMVYDDPPGFEVEFVDEHGRMLALVSLKADDLEPA